MSAAWQRHPLDHTNRTSTAPADPTVQRSTLGALLALASDHGGWGNGPWRWTCQAGCSHRAPVQPVHKHTLQAVKLPPLLQQHIQVGPQPVTLLGTLGCSLFLCLQGVEQIGKGCISTANLATSMQLLCLPGQAAVDQTVISGRDTILLGVHSQAPEHPLRSCCALTRETEEPHDSTDKGDRGAP